MNLSFPHFKKTIIKNHNIFSLPEFAHQIKGLSSYLKTTQISKHNFIKLNDKNYFIKCIKLASFKDKISHYFIYKKHNKYHRSIMEIQHNIALIDDPLYPQLKAYGLVKKKLLPDYIFLLFEKAEGHHPLGELIKHKNAHNAYLPVIFDKIHQHIESGHLHLDLWMNNILINPSTQSVKFIDLELFLLKPNASYTNRYAYIFGYFFHYGLHKHISSEHYQVSVEKFCKAIKIPIDSILLKHYMFTKIKRKEKFTLFT